MAIIENIEQFEAQLEQGIGHVYKDGPISLRQDLWLRMTGTCGVASAATSELLRGRGISNECVVSNPGFAFDPEFRHAYVRLDDGAIIDPTYTQLIEYAGILPFDVERGALEDIYPVRKVAEFSDEAGLEKVVHSLVSTSFRALQYDIRVDHYDRRNFQKPELFGMSAEELAGIFRAVWMPENRCQTQLAPSTLMAGRAIAAHIRDIPLQLT